MTLQSILIAILINAFISIVSVHDLPLGYFKIYEVDKMVLVCVTLDRTDLAKALSKDFQEISSNDVQVYLNNHSSWVFDEKTVPIEITELSQDHDHLKITGLFEGVNPDLNKIDIKNKVFLHVPNQSNIVEINLGNKMVDFHMNRRRQEITIEISEL